MDAGWCFHPCPAYSVSVVVLINDLLCVLQANINFLLSRFEDPEKVMTQAVVDLQSDLVRIRQSYAEVLATQRKMEVQKALAESKSAEWLTRAQLALSKVTADRPHSHARSWDHPLLGRVAWVHHSSPRVDWAVTG